METDCDFAMSTDFTLLYAMYVSSSLHVRAPSQMAGHYFRRQTHLDPATLNRHDRACGRGIEHPDTRAA